MENPQNKQTATAETLLLRALLLGAQSSSCCSEVSVPGVENPEIKTRGQVQKHLMGQEAAVGLKRLYPRRGRGAAGAQELIWK